MQFLSFRIWLKLHEIPPFSCYFPLVYSTNNVTPQVRTHHSFQAMKKRMKRGSECLSVQSGPFLPRSFLGHCPPVFFRKQYQEYRKQAVGFLHSFILDYRPIHHTPQYLYESAGSPDFLNLFRTTGSLNLLSLSSEDSLTLCFFFALVMDPGLNAVGVSRTPDSNLSKTCVVRILLNSLHFEFPVSIVSETNTPYYVTKAITQREDP